MDGRNSLERKNNLKQILTLEINKDIAAIDNELKKEDNKQANTAFFGVEISARKSKLAKAQKEKGVQIKN